jgi:ketosteroid isomerase-like protein
MILSADHGRIIRRNWRYLLPATALVAMITWLMIPGRIGNAGQFRFMRGNMTSTTQFQYPNGSDEEVLRTLAQKLAETLPQEDYSMSQYLNPEDCLEFECYWRPMSRAIEDFREKGSVITKIDADIDTPVLSTDGKAYLNFRAVIYFRNSRDGRETTILRHYGVSFKKENGRWQAIRDKEELALFSQSGLAVMPVWITGPPHLEGNEASPPAGRDQIHSDSEGVSTVLRELADAILSRDVSALEHILTDDYAGWFPEIENNGYAFWDAIGKTQQVAAVEKRRSSVEKFEFKNLRVYPAEGGERGAIAVFIGAPLFQIDGIDSNKKCGYYVRFDKQPGQWKVSMIKMAPTFDLTPPLFPLR